MKHLRRPIVAIGLIVALAGFASADDHSGLLIARVADDSPAEKSGLLRGDVLLAIDGNEIDSGADIRQLLEEYKAGQRVSLTILRGGEERSVRLTLEERLYRPIMGIEFAAEHGSIRLSPGPHGRGFAFEFGPGRFGMGVIVTDVLEDGPAEVAGIQPRDAIVSIDGEEIDAEELKELITAYDPGDSIEVELSRPGREAETLNLEITLGENDDGEAFLGIQYVSPGFGLRFDPRSRRALERFEREFRERMHRFRDGSGGRPRTETNEAYPPTGVGPLMDL